MSNAVYNALISYTKNLFFTTYSFNRRAYACYEHEARRKQASEWERWRIGICLHPFLAQGLLQATLISVYPSVKWGC